MQERTLGNTEQKLPAIGLGCMGLSEFYGQPMEKSAAIKLLHEAIELGVEHFDTAEVYGIGGANEIAWRSVRRSPRACIHRHQVRNDTGFRNRRVHWS